MGEIILITSGKGGTGKSTVTAGLGLSLAKFRKKVCMIDANIGMRDLDFICGLADRVFYNLYDVTERGSRLQRGILKVPVREELYLIPAPQTKAVADFEQEHFLKLLERLREHFDYILIDCPPGAGAGFELVSAKCDAAVLVVTPDASALRAADKIRTLLKRRHMFHIFVCVNHFPEHFTESTPCLKPEEIMEILPEEIGGFLRNDPVVSESWMAESVEGLLESANRSVWVRMAAILAGEEIKAEIPKQEVPKKEQPIQIIQTKQTETADRVQTPIFRDHEADAEDIRRTALQHKSLWARIFGL